MPGERKSVVKNLNNEELIVISSDCDSEKENDLTKGKCKSLAPAVETPEQSASNARRSVRKKTPNKKYFEPETSRKSTNSRKKQNETESSEEDSDNSDESSEKLRAATLLVQKIDVDGQRSLRKRAPNKKYFDSENDSDRKSRKSIRSRKKQEESETESSEDDPDGSAEEETSEKVRATTLFEDKIDVEGQQIYGFKTPKKKDSMAIMATNTPKTPKEINYKTPRKSLAISKIAKTPHQDRTKLKKKISKLVEYDDSHSDFSASESDFLPTSSSESDDENIEDASEDEEQSKPQKVLPAKVAPIESTNVSSRTRRGRQKTDLQYILQSDEYFSTHSSTKVVTSDHTLDRLKTPRLPSDKLFALLREMKVSGAHEKAIQELHDEYKRYFNKWLFLLNEGFNILLYGLGSKRNLLKNFHRLVLSNQPVIVVNGFFPSLTIKDILDSITSDILDMNVNSGNHHELVDMILEEFKRIPDTHLFLIIHNLDGTMLRNNKSQNVISRLASAENIHLIASIDHINTPLIWDVSKLSNFNFSWWDTTTMLPYADETAFENSLLVQNSGSLALSSMKNVFISLNTKARGIYLIIVKYQLENKGNPNYQGLPFKDLYWSCRESFLVSSDLALRAQLTEFLDHKLVKMKRTGDGTEHLQIPIEHGLLQQFVEQQEAA